MTLLTTNSYLVGRHPLPAGAVPLATDQAGALVCQTPHARWIRWWPATRSIESVPRSIQKLVLTAVCQRLGGTLKTGETLGVSPRTIEAWRSCRMPLPIKAAEQIARLMANEPAPA